MSLFVERESHKPLFYPGIYDAYMRIVDKPWSFTEVPMEGDVTQWKKELTEADKYLITSILKGFTKIESHVSCYWSDVIAKHFQAQEVNSFAKAASYQETVHFRAYAHLEDTLGLDVTEAFQKDMVAQAKIGYIYSNLGDDRQNLAKSLAVFSGAVEGVSLFSSFAILLSFAESSLMLGMKQILSWSVRDEHNHSEAGIELYHLLIEECPELVPNEGDIHVAFKIVVDNEINFVEKAFSMPGALSIRTTKEQIIEFIKYRANDRLLRLGFRPLYQINFKLAQQVSEWFDHMVWGIVDHDFFAAKANGGGYQAMLSQDFTKVDTTKYELPEWLRSRVA